MGTPRISVDQTGSLASVTRHDYLPYGEELPANQWGRTSAQGYAGDSVKQKFTGYERDAETNLNYAEARYHSDVQGRFTSVDPLSSSAKLTDPQTLNRYSYVGNNPVNFSDPSGMSARPGFYNLHNMDSLLAQDHANNTELADAEAAYETSLAATIEAAREADSINEGLRNGTISNEQGVDMAANNPMLAAVDNQTPTATPQDSSSPQQEVKVEVQTYQQNSYGNGLDIKLLATVKNSTYQHFNWVQTVTTNVPRGRGHKPNQPYPDHEPGQKTPFYWKPKNQSLSETIAQVHGGSTLFGDNPFRKYKGTPISWHADLSLVGIKSDGTFDKLRSYSYGFTIDRKGVHLEKLKEIQ